MKTASAAISALVFLLMVATGAAFGDDLKGYSIEATYTTQIAIGAVIAGTMPRNATSSMQHHDRMYVSMLGNVFDAIDIGNGTFALHHRFETELDKAKTVAQQVMLAWAVEPQRLLKIQKNVEGIMVETYAIDPSKTTCTISFQMQPDPKTGRTVMQLMNGVWAEVRANDVSGATCVVRKGNIFASGQ
jgi:hypothetical protein